MSDFYPVMNPEAIKQDELLLARHIFEQLVRGIDPSTDVKVENDHFINTPDVNRCLWIALALIDHRIGERKLSALQRAIRKVREEKNASNS